MIIKYLGHACFSIQNNDGKILVCDPYDSSIGYEMIPVTANVITMSHEHSDHSDLTNVSGSYDIVNSLKEYSGYGFNITFFRTFHDEEQGASRGSNISFIIECDGIKICHLGDLGHMLAYKHIKKLNDVSIICLPIGGYYTLDKKYITKLIKKLDDKLIVPMHYKTEKCTLPIAPLSKYLKTTILHTYKVNELKIDNNNISTFAPGNYVLNMITK